MYGDICAVLLCFMISRSHKRANICEMRIKFEIRISPTHGGEMVKRKSNLARFRKFLPCSYFQLKVQIICRQGLCFRLQHDPLYLCLARTSALSQSTSSHKLATVIPTQLPEGQGQTLALLFLDFEADIVLNT